jgi:hypothetical protein
MGVRVIRTVTRFSASPDTDPEKPGLDIATCPHPSPGVFSSPLDGVISPPRILRPVDCETVAHQPFAQVDIADRASCHRPPILVQRGRDAVQRPSGNKSVEIVRRLGPAPILETILASKMPSKEITPSQGVLNLGIELNKDENGIGMGVLSDGTPYLNQRGLEILNWLSCLVSDRTEPPYFSGVSSPSASILICLVPRCTC